MRLDTTPGDRLVFAALAEFIRELIVSGTRAGLAAARTRGNVGARLTVVDPDVIPPAILFCMLSCYAWYLA